MTYFEMLPVALTYGGLQIDAVYDRPYADRGGKTLGLDVFYPTGTSEPLPTVVLIHGGFWLYGEKWYMHDWAADLAEQGYTAASIEYRVIPEGGIYPEPVKDVLDAVSYLRDHATELHVDPERIALFGVSAGAHLALLAGMAKDTSVFDQAWPAGTSAQVRAIVDIYGPTDFTVDQSTADSWQPWLVNKLLGNPGPDWDRLAREASPVTYVRADGPPVFILHGDRDPIVPVTQARLLRDALQDVGEPYQYHEAPDAGHFWGSFWTSEPVQAYRAAILQFLEDYLSAPPGEEP